MAERLSRHKFQTLSSPHGILFNPLSVSQSLDSYITGKRYEETDLFFLNELWNSWDHHTRFSDIDKEAALRKINYSQQKAIEFIKDADCIMITLGSAFQYYLKDGERPVANNHRAPAQWFEKRLLSIDVIINALSAALQSILSVNPEVRFLFTVSPVRHIRDGVIENNRSKARLIDAVHELCQRFKQAYYFPAYELVIDVLRDYRFYDIDFVHPNYMATEFVWEHFVSSCIEQETESIMEQVNEIVMARTHKPRFPQTEAHKQFLLNNKNKIERLQKIYPFLNLAEELEYFSS